MKNQSGLVPGHSPQKDAQVCERLTNDLDALGQSGMGEPQEPLKIGGVPVVKLGQGSYVRHYPDEVAGTLPQSTRPPDITGRQLQAAIVAKVLRQHYPKDTTAHTGHVAYMVLDALETLG